MDELDRLKAEIADLRGYEYKDCATDTEKLNCSHLVTLSPR